VSYWLNAYSGLRSVVELAKKHNVYWGLAEVGFKSDGTDIDLLTRGLRDFIVANLHAGKGCALFCPGPRTGITRAMCSRGARQRRPPTWCS